MPPIVVPGGASTPELKAHLAVPPVGDGPWPGVVVLHEAFGLTDDIRQQADRLAAAGYVAVALDLYSAGGAWRCIRSVFRALLSGEGKAFDDIEVARAYTAGRDDCTGKVGVVGFCQGGGFALLTARRGFDASAPNYALLPDDLDAALDGACPMVASFGKKDRMVPADAADTLRAGLERKGVAHDVKRYPDAGHSFLNRHNFGPFGVVEKVGGFSYHEPSAQDAWTRILRFFDEHLASAKG
jgi:carboxymethylenebutenolidase